MKSLAVLALNGDKQPILREEIDGVLNAVLSVYPLGMMIQKGEIRILNLPHDTNSFAIQQAGTLRTSTGANLVAVLSRHPFTPERIETSLVYSKPNHLELAHAIGKAFGTEESYESFQKRQGFSRRDLKILAEQYGGMG